MAQSVSKTVRSILHEHGLLSFAFDKKLVNDSALARFIKPRVEETLGRKVSLGAVTAAVRRFILSYRPEKNVPNLIRFLKSSKLFLREGLIEAHFKRTEKTADNIAHLAKKIKWEHGEKLYVLQRSDEISVIANENHLQEILECAPKTDLLAQHSDRAVITIIRDPSSVEDTYGAIAFFTNQFAALGVTIHLVFSTYSATSFVIKQKDLPKIYKKLSDSIKELHESYPEI